MGLDLYAGTLTRYYSGQWETIVQQAARAQGAPVTVMRRPGSLIDTDPAKAQQRILQWRSGVQGDLSRANQLPSPLDWPEDLYQPYFTDKPDWNCFGAMVLLAAYTDAGEPVPAELPHSWEQDPVLRRMEAASNSGAVIRYPHLYLVEWWMPVPKLPIFTTASPLNKPIRIAALADLVEHLIDLNSRTYNFRADEIRDVRIDTPGPEVRGLEALARPGLAIMMHVAIDAVRTRLPLLLDY